MVKTLLMHIGDAKCGSTSIQTALFDAREALAAEGILYHSTKRYGGQNTLMTLTGVGFRGAGKTGNFLALARQERDEIKAMQSRFPIAVFSSERLIRSDPAKVIGLLDEMFPGLEEISVLAYVRDPFSMYLSVEQQRLKASDVIRSPAAPAREVWRLLKGWETQSRVGQFSVRCFDPRRFEQGSVVRDFETVLKSRFPERRIALEDLNANSSMSAEQLVVMQRFRAEFFPGTSVLGQETPPLIRFFEDLNAGGNMVTKPALGVEAQAALATSTREVVARLNESYPHLDFPVRSVAPENGSGPDREWKRIEDVLAHVDWTVVDALTALVPGWNRTLLSGLPDDARRALALLASHHPNGIAHVSTATARYWRQVGCEKCAAALDGCHV